MGITTDFLVKHVRPFTQQGFDTYGSRELITYLTNDLGLQIDLVVQILGLWRMTALSDPYGESDRFTAAADAVAQARWSTLYQTQASTLMFLDANELVSVSTAADRAGTNADFTWQSPNRDGIAIVVTIRQSGGANIGWGVGGFRGATDGNCNAVHFAGLL